MPAEPPVKHPAPTPHADPIADPGPIPHAAHIPALDGLRGVAILMVIIWHYCVPLRPWFPGWQGVDLFFVLSGYLITGRLQQTKGQPRYFSRYYRNRMLRIFPLYLAIVIFYLAIIRLFVRPIHWPLMAIYLDHWKSFFLFTENWTFIRFGLPTDLSLAPLWSVAIEAQFYLVWPLLIFLTTAKFRLRLLPALIAMVLLGRALAWFLHPQPFDSIYFNSLFRFDCFCTGALLYQLHHAGLHLPLRATKWVVFLLLLSEVAGMWATGSDFRGPFFPLGGFTMNAFLFAALLHLAARPATGLLHYILQSPFLRGCGKISYGLYLVHLPILLNIGPRLSRDSIINWSATGICLLLSFLVSWLSYRYFESYFLHLKHERSPETSPAAAHPGP